MNTTNTPSEDRIMIDDLIPNCDYTEGDEPNYCKWCGKFKLSNIHTAREQIRKAVMEAINTTCAWGGLPEELESFNKLREVQTAQINKFFGEDK